MFSLFTVCLELILPHAFSWMLLEHSLVDSLENIRFSVLEANRQLFPAAISTSFLSSVFPGLTRDPTLCEEISSLLWSRATGHGLDIAIGEPSFEVAS